jgi:hypothetical protein
MKGLEPLTTRLQVESSTTELHRHHYSETPLSSIYLLPPKLHELLFQELLLRA